MYNKVFFDTNVIVDLFDKKRPFHKESVEVFKTVFENDKIELYINTDTMTNLFYILRSHVKLDFKTTLLKMEFIKECFSIVSVEILDIENALLICKEEQFKDYEDALQYICAIKKDCELIITNNPKDFKNSSIDFKTTKILHKILSSKS